MKIRTIPLLAVLLFAASSTSAQPADLVTIVYDVPAREFSCWFEGAPPDPIPADPCTDPRETHRVVEGVYFFRGQTVRLLLKGAVAADLFALDLQVNDIVEPTTPVFGALSDLPRLPGLVPVPYVVTTGRVTLAAGAILHISDRIYSNLDRVDDKAFLGYLKDNLLTPASSKDLQQILSVDLDTEIRALDNACVADLQKSAKDIRDDVERLKAGTDFPSLLDGLYQLKALLDRQRALREKIIASGMAAHGKTISDAFKSVRDPQFNIIGAIDTKALDTFIRAFDGAFQEPRRFWIGKLDIDPTRNTYVLPEVGAAGLFLGRLNKEVGPAGATDATLKVLKANLLILADNWDEINIAVKRAEGFQKIVGVAVPPIPPIPGDEGILTKYTKRPDSVFHFQDDLLNLATTSVTKAAEVNQKAREIPLPDQYRQLVVGEWYGSKEIVLTVKQGGRLPLFDLSGVSDTGRVPVTGAETPPAKSTQTAPSELTAARTMRFRIHNLYHLQFGAGFVYSHTPDNRFQVFKQTATVNGVNVEQQFISQTRSRDYNLLSTLELIIHPGAQDYFPWKPRFIGDKRPAWYNDFAPLIGVSMTSPNRDFLAGVAWFPRQTAVGIKVGIHVALRDEPPNGVLLDTPLTQPVVVLSQRVHVGPFVGLTFSTQVFRDVFGFIFR